MSDMDFVPDESTGNNQWNDETLNDWEGDSLNDWEGDLLDDWDGETLNDWEDSDESSWESSSGDWGEGCGDCEEDEVPPTLTERTNIGGSAAKWKPGEYSDITKRIAPVFGHQSMQGFVEGNDCTVINVNDDQAAAFTLDWFPPTTDDPYAFGAISAAGALSKLYAVGAKPITALNIMALPCKMGIDSVGDVMRGGSDKVIEAGAFVVGGHSIDDGEPKYGLAVFGMAHPNEMIHNEDAKPGDILFCTKPLGTGILYKAFQEQATTEEEMQEAINTMMELDKNAVEAMEGLEAHAVVAVSESGLLGHLHDMLEQGECAAELIMGQIPMYEGVLEHCSENRYPERAMQNLEWVREAVEEPAESEAQMIALCDPQTSGGLLIAIAEKDANAFESAFERKSGRKPNRIGKLIEEQTGSIWIR